MHIHLFVKILVRFRGGKGFDFLITKSDLSYHTKCMKSYDIP